MSKKVFQVFFHQKKPHAIGNKWPWCLLKQKTFRMIVRAKNEQEAKQETLNSHVLLDKKDIAKINIFLCVEKPKDFNPFNDVFPKLDWMNW